MEIKVTIPKNLTTRTQKIVIDEEAFNHDITTFVNNMENLELFDQLLYDKIIAYGINKEVFDKMIVELQKFSEYDCDKDLISFPYQNWIPKLLQIEKA